LNTFPKKKKKKRGKKQQKKNLARKRILRLTSHHICNHQDDSTVRNAKLLDGFVQGKNVGSMAVVEPKATRIHQDRPIVRVIAGRRRRANHKQSDKQKQPHFVKSIYKCSTFLQTRWCSF
jgi:hypothetical protein